MRKLLLYFILFPLLSHAKVTLPSILGDNMVLQQQSDVKLWGKAKAGKKITVRPSWTNKQFQTVVNSDGRWLLHISTPKAGGPYEIKIKDEDEIILKNILIGEVWFCSGQSNMEMPVRGFEFEPVDGANDIITMSNESTLIRIYSSDFDDKGWFRQYSKTPLEDCKGQWMTNTSENVARTSATAYYFAKYLHEALDVPVGIVISSWGGSNIESWMSEETIKPFEVNLSHLYDEQEIQKPVQQQPCVLFNAKVAPLTNFTIKGFLWYQGESNRHNIEQYAKMLPAMVSDYRSRWGYDFPFYYVELAPYSYGDANNTTTAYFREMQLKHMAVIPNSGMVCTADIGSHDFIHPKNKADVGKRFAYWALANNYGRKQTGHRTPTYKSMEVKEGKVYITFENAPGKIHPINKSLQSFEIAGADKQFYPAQAIVDLKTKKLTVWSDEVIQPVAVRYAFRNYAEASIFDYYGLPVAPFRTDEW
jgi:sialate O-acetylesterase